MTVVDTTTGEVVEIADHDRATELANHVTAAIAHMNARTGEAIAAILDAYKERIWVGLGLGSWEDLVDAQGWQWKPLLPSDRAAYGTVLRTNGMSIRAIAKVAGVSATAVHRDTAGVPEVEHLEVQGTDGKTYAATQPERPEVAEEELDDLPEDLPHGPTAVESADPPHEQHREAVGPEPRADSGPTLTPDEVIDPGVEALDELLAPTADELLVKHLRSYLLNLARVPAMFPAARIRDIADAELLDSIGDLAPRLQAWANEVTATRPLRIVQGGAS